jgi:hypothetical protein
MAGLAIASRAYPTCGTYRCGTRASPSSDAIQAFLCCTKDVDARHKAGHDDGEVVRQLDRNARQRIDEAQVPASITVRVAARTRNGENCGTVSWR